MDNSSRVGVVTVTFNSASVIADFMDSMLKQVYANFTLYVIDNASTDETLERLSEYRDPRIVIIRNPNNVGVAEGNNIGIRASHTDGCTLVLLINNDTVFDANLLSELVHGLGQYDMVVPKILYFDDPVTIWCAGGYLSRIRGSARHFGHGRRDDGRFDRTRVVNYSPTCCMLIKRDVFERIGLMDPTYFVYFDDTDFCYRAHRAGIRLLYVSAARLLHKISSLTGGESNFTIRYCVRNHVYYLLKNFSGWQVVFYLPALQIHIITRFLLMLGQLKAFWVAERAFWEGITLYWSRVDVMNATVQASKA